VPPNLFFIVFIVLEPFLLPEESRNENVAERHIDCERCNSRGLLSLFLSFLHFNP
jgi:hypothetical protein